MFDGKARHLAMFSLQVLLIFSTFSLLDINQNISHLVNISGLKTGDL